MAGRVKDELGPLADTIVLFSRATGGPPPAAELELEQGGAPADTTVALGAEKVGATEELPGGGESVVAPAAADAADDAAAGAVDDAAAGAGEDAAAAALERSTSPPGRMKTSKSRAVSAVAVLRVPDKAWEREEREVEDEEVFPVIETAINREREECVRKAYFASATPLSSIQRSEAL
jgi:hypothetical protein